MPNPGLPKAKTALWLDRYRRGDTPSEIALADGVHAGTVRKYLREAGCGPMWNAPVPPEVYSTWPSQYEAGETLQQIGQSANVSQSTVSFYLKRLGVRGRRGKKHVPLKASDLLCFLPSGQRVIRVPLTRGHFALIDETDADRVLAKKWTAMEGSSGVYAVHHFREQTADGFRVTHVRLHRFLLNPPEGMVVDHIDHDGLNCTRANMRVCTLQQNVFNSRARMQRLGRKGVWRQRGGSWVASVRLNGKRQHLGTYPNLEEAQRAYDAAASRLFGAFACLNFPNESGQPDCNPLAVTHSPVSVSYAAHPTSFAATQHKEPPT